MTDPWDERTEAIPGVKKDRSIELDLEADLTPAAAPAMGFLDEPRLLVFEPVPLGVASAFSQLGYLVKSHATAVDVMDAVARETPSLVVCAPSPEPERRRMLAAALRIRFPNVPIVYVSRHARQEEAVLGAIREGARAVLAWPLPPPADTKRVLAPYLVVSAPQVAAPSAGPSPATQRTLDDVDTAPLPRADAAARQTAAAEAPTALHRRVDVTPGSDASAGFDELATAVVPQLAPEPKSPARSPVGSPAQRGAARTAPQRLVEELPSDAMRPLPMPVPLPPPNASLLGQAPVSEPPTTPARRIPHAPRGEIGDLLDALSPFWWSLDDAAHYLRDRGERGDVEAQTHARTMQALLKILEQVRARVDESGA